MFLPWPELSRRFEHAWRELGGCPARLTDLRASALFFFAHWLSERRRRDEGSYAPILIVTETTGRALRMQQFLTAVERLVEDREPRPEDFLVFPDFEPQNLFEYGDPAVDVIDARNHVLEGLQAGSGGDA